MEFPLIIVLIILAIPENATSTPPDPFTLFPLGLFMIVQLMISLLPPLIFIPPQ